MIYTLFVILIVLASLLMIGIVLIQESKGGGLSSNFSSSNAIMGVRKTTDVVEKATWGLAIAMVVLSIACAHVVPNAVTDSSVLEQSATETQTTNPNTTPGFGASQQKAAPTAGTQNTTSATDNGIQNTVPKTPEAPAK
ncbi:preprotein translocase, SecG subunit [Hoylesella oralis ATCC 33269]|uniref:Protein-export membrane protein SecG n=1 Tax=Hoylesella oralis ATCC 33269 TaxID=873533 RepID=E7RP11_9BACT|nr:preprotein translocase, SecG subunit [Hoylesella oralis ATCC 33269]EPH16060.1 preprotein translocase, SecG subunit [Hoylesella oralis HGA0225]SHF88353.1 preprotein translocase subunit SecG [Hoylesella oralis]